MKLELACSSHQPKPMQSGHARIDENIFTPGPPGRNPETPLSYSLETCPPKSPFEPPSPGGKSSSARPCRPRFSFFSLCNCQRTGDSSSIGGTAISPEGQEQAAFVNFSTIPQPEFLGRLRRTTMWSRVIAAISGLQLVLSTPRPRRTSLRRRPSVGGYI